MTVPEEVVRVLRMRPVWPRVLLAGGVRERGMVLEGVGERGVLLVCGCVSRVRVRGGIRGCESEEMRVSEACASPVGVRVPDPPRFMGVRPGPFLGRFDKLRAGATDILHHVTE